MANDLKELNKQFLEHLEIEKGRSLLTVENYGRYLKRFFDFAKIDEPKEITDDLLRSYRLYLNRLQTQAGNTLNRKTQNYNLIALRAFLKYLAKREIKSLAPEKIELAKTTQRELDLISESDLARLLASPEGSELVELRDKTILEMLFSTGLRVSELCALNRENIENALGSGEFSIRGKGGKIRVVFLSETAKKAIKDYLKKRADTDESLFVRISNIKSQTSNLRLTPRTIERIIKHYAIKAGISKKVTPHTMRHCFATDLLSNGADIRSVQSLLGHSNISTTQIYTHITDKQLRDVHKMFHGKRNT